MSFEINSIAFSLQKFRRRSVMPRYNDDDGPVNTVFMRDDAAYANK